MILPVPCSRTPALLFLVGATRVCGLTILCNTRPRQRGGSNTGSAMRRPTLLQARYGVLADLRSLKCSCSLAQRTRLAHYPLENILFTNAPGYMGLPCKCDNKSIRSRGGVAGGAGTTTVRCDRTIEKDKSKRDIFLSKGGWQGSVAIPRQPPNVTVPVDIIRVVYASLRYSQSI